MTRPPDNWIPPRIYYAHPDDPPICGYTTDLEMKTRCGRPAVYEFRLKGDDARGGACAEHAQLVRTHPGLDRMWSL